mgnify:CR=1 FL=1
MDLFFLEGTGNLDTGKTADATTFGFATEGGQAFDGCDVAALGLHRQHQAAAHRLAVDLRASWSSNIPKMTSDPKLRVGAVSRRKAVASSTAGPAGTSAKMAALRAV